MQPSVSSAYESKPHQARELGHVLQREAGCNIAAVPAVAVEQAQVPQPGQRVQVGRRRAALNVQARQAAAEPRQLRITVWEVGALVELEARQPRQPNDLQATKKATHEQDRSA